MTGKERLKATIRHVEPDRVCVDFGSNAVTGMHVRTVELLRGFYGLEKKPVKVCEPYQMLGEIEDDLRERLGIDTEPLVGHGTIFGFRNEDWKLWTAPWGQDVLVPADFQVTCDAHGDTLIFPQGDRSAPPSGRMPATGYFFDCIVRQPEMDEENLSPEDNLEEFSVLDEEALNWYQSEAIRLEGSSRGIVASTPGSALGDIALVPGPFLKYPKGIRDISEWYISTVSRQDYIHEVFRQQTDIAIENMRLLKEVTGDLIDVVFTCGTDFGTQTSQFCSADTYEELWAPYYRRMNDWIHENTSWKTFKHCCGAVYPLIAHFVDSGFDILNPVQCSAADMDPQRLKDEFGDRIVFWGGGVDTQKTLPFGTPEEVYREVRERIDIFAPGGGFVFDAIHNVQANTPIENVVAMFKALEDARSLVYL
ncbi:methyltransferase [Verrucomicrobia bacterium S94]|nr:methyltransferase [Verrucomicrobia bacterium S94]